MSGIYPLGFSADGSHHSKALVVFLRQEPDEEQEEEEEDDAEGCCVGRARKQIHLSKVALMTIHSCGARSESPGRRARFRGLRF